MLSLAWSTTTFAGSTSEQSEAATAADPGRTTAAAANVDVRAMERRRTGPLPRGATSGGRRSTGSCDTRGCRIVSAARGDACRDLSVPLRGVRDGDVAVRQRG